MDCTHEMIPKCTITGQYNYNIDISHYFPTIGIHIDGIEYLLTIEDYLFQLDDILYLGIMTHDTIQEWILGLNFFHNYYVIFDNEEH